MKGIDFIVDENGKHKVVIDLEEYGEIWEDIYDSLLIEARKNDPRETLEEVNERLRRSGKLPE